VKLRKDELQHKFPPGSRNGLGLFKVIPITLCEADVTCYIKVFNMLETCYSRTLLPCSKEFLLLAGF